LNWYDRVNAQVDVQEANLSKSFKDYSQYREQVRNYVRQLPPDQRAKPGVVELAYYVVRGQSFDKNVQQKQDEIVARIRSGEAVQGINAGTTSSSRVSAPPQVSAIEAEIASKMGMTAEEYQKHKK